MKEFMLKYLKNRYVLVILGLFVYLLFLEETDLFTLAKYKSKVNDLEQQKEYLEQEIIETQQAITELTTDEAALEKFAREQHYMKRDNEDVFVFLEEEAQED
ncbi:MAG: septum formation initiator family protein [Flavobacteriales bacterium]|nr:septum formation initiator family protein [Flavobacteriales bacterium]